MPDSLEFYFEFVASRHRLRGGAAGAGAGARSSALSGVRREWEIELPIFRCPHLRRGGGRGVRSNEFEVESIEVEEVRMHRTKVKVVEDALDANNTIARGEPRRTSTAPA